MASPDSGVDLHPEQKGHFLRRGMFSRVSVRRSSLSGTGCEMEKFCVMWCLALKLI